ncbi:MAG TPA: hypothetical protein VK431_07155 [Nitrosopumilaceae archaeon]|nr:hypothetical protein [Nitrosopumilaceae archaeon]
MRTCTCRCDCKKEFEEISDQSLALLIALSEGKIPHDKTICNGCRFDKHRQHRMKRHSIPVRI